MNSSKSENCNNLKHRILFICLCYSIFAFGGSTTEFDKANSNALEMPTNQEEKLKKVFEEYKKLFPIATNLPNTEEAKKEFKPPKIISSSTPTYPDSLRRRGVEGEVYVALLKDEQGKVIDTFIVQSSNKNLNEAAVQSVMSWQFSSALVSDIPKKSVVIAPITFQINQGNSDANNGSSTGHRPINSVLPNLQYLP